MCYLGREVRQLGEVSATGDCNGRQGENEGGSLSSQLGKCTVQSLFGRVTNGGSGRDAHAENVGHTGVDWVYLPPFLGLKV